MNTTTRTSTAERLGRAFGGRVRRGGNGLGFLDLEKGWSSVPDREEQFRVLVQARCPATPIHADRNSSSAGHTASGASYVVE